MTGKVKVRGLREIAAWQFPDILKTADELKRLYNFRPGIPSLQRGAVWKPRQIEFLWDSLMRGFPIGSFVVCRKLENQGIRKSDGTTVTIPDEAYTHHLLDGQQRANAVALGFVDPHGVDDALSACLWLDLLAKPQDARRYLFRVTTQAHPWGYDKDDASSRLKVEQIRTAVKPGGGEFSMHDLDVKRAYGHWPIAAVFPVPVAWLLQEANIPTAVGEFINWLNERIQKSEGLLKSRLTECLGKHSDQLDSGFVARLQKALDRLYGTQLFALEVSPEILEDSDGESAVGASDAESGRVPISNVEHLFTRLNSAGTNLDGAELSYSLIKAYWPEIEAPISRLPRFDNEARLASLAFRHALSTETELASPLSIPAIRRLAVRRDDDASKDREAVRALLGLDDAKIGQGTSKFQGQLQSLELLLGWSENRRFGLHRFLVCDMFRRNPELVLLLLDVAPRIDQSSDCTRFFLGLATALHWFAGESERDRKEAAKLARSALGSGKLTDASFHGVLAKNQNEGRGSIPLILPFDLERLLPEFDVANKINLKDWDFWNALPELEGGSRQHWPFVHRLKDLKFLLLFSQREMISRRWPDYDPSNSRLWEDHDRPWDYDHLLPHDVLYNRKQPDLVYKKVGDRWLNTIGNFRAWPFEANRSRQDQELTELPDEERTDSLLAPRVVEPVNASKWPAPEEFCHATDAFKNAEGAVRFMNAARKRMISMYRDWFETLQIEVLLGSAGSPSSKGSEERE